MIDFFIAPDGETAEIQVLRAALDSYNDRFGPRHPLVLDVIERLALAYWKEGEIVYALALLERTVGGLPEQDHSVRIGLMGIVWKILFAAGRFAEATRILGEVVDLQLRIEGPNHPDTLAAQGDLSVVLFEIGDHGEAEALGSGALEKARACLGPTDPVTCILAWNQLMRRERSGDPESARAVAVRDLLWLLAEDPVLLDPDLREIQSWLADRFTWDSAPVC
jgi:tetratricopeptide (TPR) repeat protein